MAVLEVKDLEIGYGEKTILKDVNFSVEAGEFIGIIGCNGAGKSTILKTIRGMLDKKKGIVKYFDKPLEEYKEKELAMQVAYLQQHVETSFGYSCMEIVLAGRYPYMKWFESETDADKQLCRDCMAYTGTEDLANRPINAVSGGQKQRVLLAKVLAQQTAILLLDEPTTGLDMVYQEEIFRFARELSKSGKTIIMVVHELSLAAKYCRRLLLIGEGGLLADGAPAEVLTVDNLSRAYKADVTININPNTGNYEISTQQNTEASQNKKELLNKICASKK